ncbi:MAG: hypothetical protein WBD36_05190, partial [Bacteroidota bacterium]
MQPKPSSFEGPGTDKPNAFGCLDFSIPLYRLTNGTGLLYDLSLHYASGIRYFDNGGSVGLGWSIPEYRISRTVRGFPDEEENRATYEGTYPTETLKGYKRVGKFGWLDYRDYSDGWNFYEPEYHGYGGRLSTDYANVGQEEVEDLYYLTSPIGSGRLVYHHFEVDNPRFNNMSISAQWGRAYNDRGLDEYGNDAYPPKYRIYFYLEKYEGVKVVLHIDKGQQHAINLSS